MRFWISGPRMFGGMIRPGISIPIGGGRSRSRTAQGQRQALQPNGYVYVIGREHDQRIKIGSSVDPISRLASLQTGSADLLTIEYTHQVYGNAAEVEYEAHNLLDRHRGMGEWFDVPVHVAVAAISSAAYRLSAEAPSEPSGRLPPWAPAALVAALIGVALLIVVHVANHPTPLYHYTSGVN